MTICLIRHGRTEANGQFYAGRADIPLDETGRAQARTVAEELAGHPLDLLLSSPLQRALDTAAPLAAHRGLRVETVPALSELDFGELQGQPKAALVIRKAHLLTRIEGGDSLLDLWCRLKPVADRILAAERRHLNTAVIAHFWSLRLLAGLLREMSLEAAACAREARLSNGAIMVLRCGEAGSGKEAVRVNRS